MTNAQLAQNLAREAGFFVFPTLTETLEYKGKTYAAKSPDPRITPKGFLDATDNPDLIEQMWSEYPEHGIGVWCGPSGIIVLDLDVKFDDAGEITVDGLDSLDKAWLDVPESFGYDSLSGYGRHIIYKTPEDVTVGPAAKYRNMPGIDRRAGNSYVVWATDEVPDVSKLAEAPEWLCDESKLRSLQQFEGNLKDWYDSLVLGEPNALVRRAVDRISDDMSHGQMIERQHEAIRLGGEGNPGVPALLEALENAFLSRDPGLHATPESEWQYKFMEGLVSGVQKYGALTDRLANLPEYKLSMVPAIVKDAQVTGDPLSPPEFTRLLHTLTRELSDDDQVASILWNASAPKHLAREWGLDFLYTRITEARQAPQPDQENPSLEEAQKVELTRSGLLTDEERKVVAATPTLEDEYYQTALGEGFANEKLTRSAAWTVASMAYGFRAFIPVTSTDKMGVNLWSIQLAQSGSGKSRALKFRDTCLETLFPYVEGETGYDLGADSSIPGLHEALLNRDKKPSFFGTDEASGFFKSLARDGNYQHGMDDTLSDWYEGKIRPSNKVRLKELKGKSALTSFTIQMVATPDRLIDALSREQFMSGFLARFQWTIGDPPKNTDDRFKLHQNVEIEEIADTPESIENLVLHHLIGAGMNGGKSMPVLATEEALERMGEAYKHMFRSAEGRKNWDIIEPSVTRLMEAMRKVAALITLNRGETTTRLGDALCAIAVIEQWYDNLFIVADKISQGEYQKNLKDIEAWIRGQGGTATKPRIYHRFGDVIKKGKRELDDLLEFLQESGVLLRREREGRVEFTINE